MSNNVVQTYRYELGLLPDVILASVLLLGLVPSPASHVEHEQEFAGVWES